MKKLSFSDESEEDPLAELADLEASLHSESPEAGGSIREKSGPSTPPTKLKNPITISKKNHK